MPEAVASTPVTSSGPVTPSITPGQNVQQGQNVKTTDAAPANATEAKAMRELGADDMDALVKFNIDGKVQTLPLREALKEIKAGRQIKTKYEKRTQEFEQANQIRGKAEYLLQLAQRNPKRFYEETGQDPYAAAEKLLAEKLEYMEMSPAERRAVELEHENAQLKAEKEQFNQKQQAETFQKAETEYATKLDKELAVAFNESGLPRDKWYVQMTANELIGAMSRNEELSPKEAVAIVKERILSGHLPEILKSMPIHQLAEVLDSRRKELREYEVQAVKHQDGGKEPSKAPGTPARAQSSSKKPMRTDAEYRAWVDSLK